MGFFKKTPIVCDVCKSDVVGKPRSAKDGNVCDECYTRAGFPAPISITTIPVSILREQIYSNDGLSITKRAQRRSASGPAAAATASPAPTPVGNNVPKCALCGSTSISADKKGYGIGKGVVGAAVAGPIGLVLGNAGAKKVRITCLACGHQWMAGKHR